MQYNASAETVRLLLNANPAAASCRDDVGDFPLHCALANEAEADAVSVLLAAYPRAAELKDGVGWMPVHLGWHFKAPLATMLAILPFSNLHAHMYSTIPGGLQVRGPLNGARYHDLIQWLELEFATEGIDTTLPLMAATLGGDTYEIHDWVRPTVEGTLAHALCMQHPSLGAYAAEVFPLTVSFSSASAAVQNDPLEWSWLHANSRKRAFVLSIHAAGKTAAETVPLSTRSVPVGKFVMQVKPTLITDVLFVHLAEVDLVVDGNSNQLRHVIKLAIESGGTLGYARKKIVDHLHQVDQHLTKRFYNLHLVTPTSSKKLRRADDCKTLASLGVGQPGHALHYKPTTKGWFSSVRATFTRRSTAPNFEPA
jgi:hypothetical protein